MKLLLILAYFFLISCSNAHTMSKKPLPDEKKTNHKKAFGKSKGYFQVRMQSIDNGNGDFTLTADIIPRKEMAQTEVRWKIPAHLTLLDGEKSTVLDFQVGEVQQVSITLEKSELQESDQIFLFVTKAIGGERHGTSHSFVYHEKNNVETRNLKQQNNKRRKFIE